MSARAHVLARIRSALEDVPAAEGPGDVPVPRDYLRTLGLSHADVIERLVERLGDYGTDVRRCVPGGEAETIGTALVARGAPVSDVERLPWGEFISFEDPDGNRWSVQAMPR